MLKSPILTLTTLNFSKHFTRFSPLFDNIYFTILVNLYYYFAYYCGNIRFQYVNLVLIFRFLDIFKHISLIHMSSEAPNFVLFEHAVGYSLFKVKEFEDIGQILPEVC